MNSPSPAPATRHDLDGLAVVRRRPPASETTVVLVHGAMDRAASFGRVMRRLSGLDTVAYDRRGYDGSLEAGRTPADLDGHAEDLWRVMRWSGSERIVVVGHSLGGTIALLAAAAGPQESALVAVGAFEAPLPRPGYAGPAGERTLAVAAIEGSAAAAEGFYRDAVGEAAWARLGERERTARRAEGPALVAELAGLRDHAPPGAGSIEVDLHVGRGGLSHPALRHDAEELARVCGARLEELPGAGHGAHLSHPGDFARWVLTVAGGPTGSSVA